MFRKEGIIMFRYILSHGEYEDHEEFELLHEKQFTQDEFKKIIRSVIKEMKLHNVEDNQQFIEEEYIKAKMIQNYGFTASDIQCYYHTGNYGVWE